MTCTPSDGTSVPGSFSTCVNAGRFAARFAAITSEKCRSTAALECRTVFCTCTPSDGTYMRAEQFPQYVSMLPDVSRRCLSCAAQVPDGLRHLPGLVGRHVRG